VCSKKTIKFQRNIYDLLIFGNAKKIKVWIERWKLDLPGTLSRSGGIRKPSL
jgi:hypothetical protein